MLGGLTRHQDCSPHLRKDLDPAGSQLLGQDEFFLPVVVQLHSLLCRRHQDTLTSHHQARFKTNSTASKLERWPKKTQSRTSFIIMTKYIFLRNSNS